MDKRFIEDSFPVFEVSEESAKEKSIRHGHISTLHIWWARRPLSSSRATNYASLIPAPENIDEWEKKRNFIIELSKWKNSLNRSLIEKARKDILISNNNVPPKVLDPFSGGGAIPLESLRLGCEAYANDYNPVAVLIEKCTLVYPQIYGNPSIKTKGWSENDNKLINDLTNIAMWVLGETKNEIEKFYPNESDGTAPVGYIWARTVKCLNPNCEAEVPLMKQFWLSNKENKKIALKPIIKDNVIDFEILDEKEFPNDFDPSLGTVKRSIVRCPACGTVIEAKKLRQLFQRQESNQKLIATVINGNNKRTKSYRLASKKDEQVYEDVKSVLDKKSSELEKIWNISPIPDEKIPLMSGTFNVPIYGLNEWGELFNNRQKLVLITFCENVRNAYDKLLNEGYDPEYAKALVTYLGIAVDRLADYNSNLTRWVSRGEFIGNTLTRQALPMVWDYFELCPWSEATGDWNSALGWINRVIENLSLIPENNLPVTISQASADHLPYEDNFFDAVFTDPPYYNSVPYADLSDFFYVWLRRSIGNLHPDLFATPLTPKSKEIVEMAGWDKKRYSNKDKEFFETKLSASFKEIQRVLKPNGITNIVYAHKTTEGWETLINALLDSGLTVTASWPISTEMKARLRAKGAAALASSIYVVARKIGKKELGWLNEVKEEINEYVPKKLDKLWNEEISGADFFISAIGSAIEVFGKYEKIMDFEGNEVRADQLLSYVRDVVTDYSVRHILHNGIAAELSPLTKFYLLWRWNYREATVPFDEARKLAQSAGIDLSNEWNKGFIKKIGENIKVIGPETRKEEEIGDSIELIDVLHKCLILWSQERKNEMNELLETTGWGNRDAFYKVGQAISETLVKNSKEKKLLDGFLPTKRRFLDSKESTKQITLDRGQ